MGGAQCLSTLKLDFFAPQHWPHFQRSSHFARTPIRSVFGVPLWRFRPHLSHIRRTFWRAWEIKSGRGFLQGHHESPAGVAVIDRNAVLTASCWWFDSTLAGIVRGLSAVLSGRVRAMLVTLPVYKLLNIFYW